MLRQLLFMALVPVFLFSGAWGLTVPHAYERLGTSLNEELESLQALREHPYFEPYRKRIDAFGLQLAEAFQSGLQLDETVAGHAPESASPAREFLQKLRKLQSFQQELRRIYAGALQFAMEHDDRPLFESLLEHPLEPIENRHIREQIREYYGPRQSSWHSARAEALLEDMAFEAESRVAYVKELKAYEASTSVTIAESDKREKRLLKRFRNMLVYMVRKGDAYELYAENGNVYSVTATVRFVNAKNIAFGGGKSVTVELGAKSAAPVRKLMPIDPGRSTAFGLNMTVAMGMVSARHDDAFVYRIPFAPGRQVTVTQGYGRRTTHHGPSTYAIDFKAPVGTPIFAARAGTVVATESRNTRSGYDKSFANDANYILIEHEDHTFSEYAHLMPHGVSVAVGQKVRRGEPIGFSGNTGYSNGPHLHFEVFKADDPLKGSTMSLPVRMESAGKIVANPRRGDVYTVSM